jgi:hypothetical protein
MGIVLTGHYWRTININLIAPAIALAFSTGAIAENMSKFDYNAAKDKIAAEYKSAKAGCDSLSGNAKDICAADAKGKDKIGLAELEATYKPSPKTHYEARVVKAEAEYSVANERCDDQAGNAKDVCVKEAIAARTAAMADAKAQMKTSDANATAVVVAPSRTATPVWHNLRVAPAQVYTEFALRGFSTSDHQEPKP